MRLPDFEAWAIFAKVAELGSFTKAAAEIQLSKPTISKAISRLEESLGATLFNRNSRHVSLTETGDRLLGYANRIVMEAKAAEMEAKDNKERLSGKIRITAPVTFGIKYLSHIIPKFMELFPDIELNVHFNDALTDLVADGYDLAIRIGSLPDSSLKARKLCNVATILVASQKFLETTGPINHPKDLAGYKGFVYTNTPTPGILQLHETKSGNSYSLNQLSRITSNNGEFFLPSIESGLGYGLLPDFITSEKITSGSIQHILPNWQGRELGVYLVTPQSKARPARTKEFINYLLVAFEKPLNELQSA